MKYIARSNLETVNKSTLDRISLWKLSFKKGKMAKDLERRLQIPDQNIGKFVWDALEKGKQYILSIIPVTNETATSTGKCHFKLYHTQPITATYLFLSLGYGNWQRAGAVVNLTLLEAESAIFLTSSSLHVTSAMHKTTTSHGPAVMALQGKAGDSIIFNN